MKSMKMKLLYFFLVLFFVFVVQYVVADPPPPPPPGGGHGATGNQGPLNGPIPDGLIVFMSFAVAYAGYEFYKFFRQRRAEADQQ